MAKVEVKREVNAAFDRKVYNAINYYRGYADDKFAKLLVLETPNAVYWAKDNFKSKSPSDVAKHNGVKVEDMVFVEGNSSYGSSDFEVFMFEPDNKYFFRIRFGVGCKVTGSYYGNRLEVRFSHAIKVYPDKCYRVTQKLSSFEDFKNDINGSKLYQRKESKRWMGNTCVYSDIDTRRVKNPAITASWRKELSNNTLAKFKQFFLDNGVAEKYLADLDKHMVCINNFLNKANILSTATAADTREKLLRDVFVPMYDKAKMWIKTKSAIPCKEYDEWLSCLKNEKDTRIQYYGSQIRPCLVRDGDWIMCVESLSSWGKVVFYNAKFKKKYMANIHNNGINNYGVFNIDCFNLLPNYDRYYRHTQCYINHYNYSSSMNINFLVDDFEYIDSMKMYNIEGAEISYKECFKDTPVISIVESAMKQPLLKVLNNSIENIKNNNATKAKDILEKIDVSGHTVEKIVSLNRVPIAYFLILCLKKDYQLAAEQLAKSGYNGILYKMVTDQNTFKGQDEESGRYWRSVVLFDKTQTNLKGCFGMSASH